MIALLLALGVAADVADWTARGGHLVSFDVRAVLAGTFFAPMTFPAGSPAPCNGPNGMPVLSANDISGQGAGGGGGIGGRVNYMYAWMRGGAVWAAMRAGTGVDAAFMYSSRPDQLGCTVNGSDVNVVLNFNRGTSYAVTVPLAVGPMLGVGRADGGRWRGAVLGLAYAPSFTFTPGVIGFNYGGAELSIDFVTLDLVADRATKPAHFRLAFFVLPPIGVLAFYGSVSLGAVWY